MPNRRTHQRVGQPAGGVYAGIRAARSVNGNVLIEGIAGLLGGDFGSAWPDWLEPAAWNHRRFCHSWLAGGSLAALACQVEQWAEACREKAADHRQCSCDSSMASEKRLYHSFAALLLSALAGFLNGLLAGYLSHLLLDLGTPSGLPVC